jgi:hypothetical protein
MDNNETPLTTPGTLTPIVGLRSKSPDKAKIVKKNMDNDSNFSSFDHRGDNSGASSPGLV